MIPQERQKIIWAAFGWTDIEEYDGKLIGFPPNQKRAQEELPPLDHNTLYELVGRLDEKRHQRYLIDLLCLLGISDFVTDNYAKLDRASAEQRAEALRKLVQG